MALLSNWGWKKLKKTAVVLKSGREKAVLQRHHWIFSGAIASLPSFEDGDILPVYSHSEKLLGFGYFNRKSQIIGRMISFGEEDPFLALQRNIDEAIALRQSLFNEEITNAYRLINGEGDGIPGLIVDKYADVLVMQISALGMDCLREKVIEMLVKTLKPRALYEKSRLPSRKEEGLKEVEGLVWGEDLSEITIKENGHSFLVSVLEGQKTGFFLDHRNMRKQVQEMAHGKKVLNCFSYTGGFSIYAAKGGAKSVTNVDSSEQALEIARKNTELNHIDKQKFVCQDAFRFLEEDSLEYDLVILDPPAFAKKKKHINQAAKGYHQLNRIAMQKMPRRSLLLTCSCSYFVDTKLFQQIVFQAALEAKREVVIIGRHQLAQDHPINLFHPEGDYLKSLLLYVK